MTRSQFLKVLQKYDAVLDMDCEEYDLNIDAPKGKVFSENGCHCIVEPFANNCNQSWKSDAYAEAAKRVAMGLYDCDNPN